MGLEVITLSLKHPPDASKVRGNKETSAWFVVTSEAKKPSACKFQQNMELSPRSRSPSEVNNNTSAWLVVPNEAKKPSARSLKTFPGSPTKEGKESSAWTWFSQDLKP